MGEGMWKPGTVTELMWRDEEMEQGQVCPYKVKLDEGGSTWAPADENDVIRREIDVQNAAKRQKQQA